MFTSVKFIREASGETSLIWLLLSQSLLRFDNEANDEMLLIRFWSSQSSVILGSKARGAISIMPLPKRDS